MWLCVVVRGDEDADHDRVAAGADHAGAEDEGADARLVEANLAGGLLVEGSVALRCVRCGIALRWVAWLGAASGPGWAGRRAAGGAGSAAAGRAGG
eukprot:7069818-Prymnesium_polylepis.1